MSSVQAGIGSILGLECEKPLRRTLSAVDMSSKKWLSSNQSGFSPLEEIASSSSDELQNIAVEQQQQQQPGQFDIWSSIQVLNPSSLPPPYVHPLVKKSKSCLSLKSLEICTENLGSESGSSNVSLSGTDEEHEEEEKEEAIQEEAIQEAVKVDVKQVIVMNYSKKSSTTVIPRSFPPPLNSLSRPGGGGGIQMKTHRMDGRLVLESVSVPASQNCFNAQRQDGRLVLTFASPIPESKSFDNSVEDDFETDEEVELECSRRDEIEQEEGKRIVLEMTSTRVLPELQPTGVMNVHRSALMVNKFTGLKNNRNDFTTWPLSSKYNQLSFNLILSSPTLAAGEALPQGPQQTVAAVAAAVEAASFNRYEYYWRKETSSMASDNGGIYHSLNQQSLPNTKNTCYSSNNSNNLLTSSKNNYYINNNSNNNFCVKDSITRTKRGIDYVEEKQKVVEHLIVAAYCKQEPKRSIVFRVPHCVATS